MLSRSQHRGDGRTASEIQLWLAWLLLRALRVLGGLPVRAVPWRAPRAGPALCRALWSAAPADPPVAPRSILLPSDCPPPLPVPPLAPQCVQQPSVQHPAQQRRSLFNDYHCVLDYWNSNVYEVIALASESPARPYQPCGRCLEVWLVNKCSLNGWN